MGDEARTEICITGFGGQGVVLAAHIIGHACALNAGKHATMIQSFGPEARGSACTASLVVSDAEVLYPYADHPNILVAMSADGYEKHAPDLAPDGIVVYEEDLVTPTIGPEQQGHGIGSTRIAEELGRRIVQNIVMVGFGRHRSGLGGGGARGGRRLGAGRDRGGEPGGVRSGIPVRP